MNVDTTAYGSSSGGVIPDMCLFSACNTAAFCPALVNQTSPSNAQTHQLPWEYVAAGGKEAGLEASNIISQPGPFGSLLPKALNTCSEVSHTRSASALTNSQLSSAGGCGHSFGPITWVRSPAVRRSSCGEGESDCRGSDDCWSSC